MDFSSQPSQKLSTSGGIARVMKSPLAGSFPKRPRGMMRSAASHYSPVGHLNSVSSFMKKGFTSEASVIL